MRVLAVDSTTERESVALVEGDEVLGEVRLRRTPQHSRQLLPAIEFLLHAAGTAPADVTAYAVTVGPGSFTGLRVGLSTVQGLALALDRPCLGLSALDVLAARIRGTAPFLVPLMEGGRGQVYTRLYDSAGEPQDEARATDPGPLLQGLPENAAFVGDAVSRLRESICLVRPMSVFPARSAFLAGSLGLLAEPLLRAGKGVRPGELRPLYLRDAHIRTSPS